MISPPPFPGSGQVCRLCGRPIDANTAALRNGICKAPACEAERTREAARAIQQRDWHQYLAATEHRLGKAAAVVEDVAAQTGRATAEMRIQMLPRQIQPMTGPDPTERAAFTVYLREIVDRSFEDDPEPQRIVGRIKNDEPEPVYAQAACATCKGDCCNLGGEHRAFLDAGVISEFRAVHPDWDADKIFDAYADRLAQVTPAGSCQFHGPLGCTLERDQRAQLCNTHHCRALKYLLCLNGLVGEVPVALIALDEEGDGYEAATVEGDDWQPVEVSDVPEIGDARRDAIVAQGLGWLPEVSPMIQPVRQPQEPARACNWCGQPITINQAATTQSCDDPDCQRQRTAALARRYRI